MALISVQQALEGILDGATALDAEWVALSAAAGRILAHPLTARRTQPPFRAAAMDGYAVRWSDLDGGNAILPIAGQAAAGHAFANALPAGTAVRIFTGAPVPDGADTVMDFSEGDRMFAPGQRLGWQELTLAAAMDFAEVPVIRRPRVAILATGDELVPPGTSRRADQIVASNSYGIAALVESRGGLPLDCGIVDDTVDATIAGLHQALSLKPDIVVTLGGASVGDHDLVRFALDRLGLELDFWKVAMRPGKPLMSGRIGDVKVLGLPGNPVSSLIGALVFLVPLMDRFLGRSNAAHPVLQRAVLGRAMQENDQRADYVRASLEKTEQGVLVATPFDLQDSSMIHTLAVADCLIVREPHAPAMDRGEPCHIILLRD